MYPFEYGENFNTKNGGLTKNCVPMYTWGGLMAYMAVEEVFEISAFEGLKFGNLSGDYATIKNLRVGKDLYDVISGKDIKVYKNSTLLIETNIPAIIKIFIINEDTCQMEVIRNMSGTCIVYSNVNTVSLKIDNEVKVYNSNGSGYIKITL